MIAVDLFLMPFFIKFDTKEGRIMNTDTTNHDSIKLNINSTGPHYEHMSEFQRSFFKSVYTRAFMQLDEIIGNFKGNSKNGIILTNKKYYDTGAAIINNTYESFSNIITFSGKRGSGKSSAMLSFMEALKHYYSYGKIYDNNLPYKFNNSETPLFSCLDCIDGSLLEHGEDIFKIVLAQIYQKFIDLDKDGGIHKEGDFAYRKRELLLQLENIYKTVCDIENMGIKETQMGESYMNSLQSLSSSQKVKRDFEVLIKKFTSLMKYERFGILEESADHYVIISIDDIDLNISNGFSMLEKIHRYCMVQNVIVLLSVDIEQMLSITFKSFYKVLPKVDKLLRDGERRVYELSTDYLNKIMPANYRLYIPELSDYYSTYTLSLSEENLDIKNYILRKLYERIGVYFDSQGVKQHFYEPRTMRQLACFYLMLESMNKPEFYNVYFKTEMIEKEKKTFIALWEENYQILTADLWNRIVVEKLHTDKDAYDLCEMIKKEDVRRAKDMVISFYLEVKNASDDSPKCVYCKAFNNVHNTQTTYKENYSYGQLIESIYEMGRIKNGKYKPLVHYLLGYFSYAFTRIYIYEKILRENALIKKGTFQSLIGKNIVDKWSKLIMPGTVMEHNRDVSESSSGSEDQGNLSHETLSRFEGVTLTNIFSFLLKEDFSSEGENEKDNQLNYIAGLISNLELILLFFSNIKESDQNGFLEFDKITWSFEIERRAEGKYIIFRPQIDNSPKINIVGDYNVLNFIGNSMNAVEVLEKFEEGLSLCLAEEYGLVKEETRRSKKMLLPDLSKKLKENSLKVGFEKWQQDFDKFSLPLPLYWFDFTYNVLKRLKRAMTEEFIVSRATSDMFDYIQKLYTNILKQLEQQREFYKDEKKKDEVDFYKLKERFEECPVVKYFLDVKKLPKKVIEERKKFIHEKTLEIFEYREKG